jgi:hypothetical protein
MLVKGPVLPTAHTLTQVPLVSCTGKQFVEA